jgi:hypothetical protein
VLVRFLVVLATLAGCYAPELAPCTIRCRLTFDCPPDMGCGDDKFCHRSTDEPACPCIPLACNDVVNACGTMPDTCGGTVECGGCAAPDECGGAGLANICGDPANCEATACEPGSCGPSTDSCGNARECPDCPLGKKCSSGTCVPCTPNCVGELACGDDGCGRSCGACPDERWTCEGTPGLCCIPDGERCTPLTEGCNCCEGLFCISGFCTPASGCNEVNATGYDVEIYQRTGEIVLVRAE